MSVARYVEQHLVDVVTRGRHELLCTTAAYLHSVLKEPLAPAMEAQMAASLTFRPSVFRLIQALQHEQLDMAALIRTPDELEKAGLGELGIPEGPAVLEQALECAVQALEELDRKVQQNDGVKVEEKDAMDIDGAEEDPVVKKLRLTLLALAKRAPLDKIAPLPAALVPAHIRKIVPTI
jgi:bromodomain-containing protein 7/9